MPLTDFYNTLPKPVRVQLIARFFLNKAADIAFSIYMLPLLTSLANTMLNFIAMLMIHSYMYL